jgi:phosphoenolpyruvate carboxylase
MRREVRLLGDILGEIIRDSGGPGLLADVERLRHAVIEARHGDHDAGDEIAGLVASWSLERAEQVARAFAVYFHLANLAEEHQRIRNLRERDTGTEPVRESLAAAVAGISHDAGPEHLRELHEQIDLLWRTSQLRVKAMDPIDEVRTVMTAFDETLFRGDAWLLRLGQGARPGQRHPAALRYPGPAGSLGY